MSAVAHPARLALRIERPNGSLHQPLPDDPRGVCSAISRLAPLVPSDATWRVVPDRPLHPAAAPS